MPSLREAERQDAGIGLEELDFYRVFAFAFGLPSSDRFAWLARDDVKAALDALGEQLGVPRFRHARNGFSDYQAYESTYLALFEVGLPGPPVPLQESSHHHAVPAQQIVLDCVNFYSVLGLRNEGACFPADHLVTQLEFLAVARFAREHATGTKNKGELLHLECDFMERHLLLWLPIAQRKLDKLGPPLFPGLLCLTHALLQDERRALREDANRI